MRYLEHIILVLSFCIALLVFPLPTLVAQEKNEAGSTVEISDFSKYQKLSASLIPRIAALENVKLSEAELETAEIPLNWGINWTTFPEVIHFGKSENGFSVDSPDAPLDMFSDWHIIRHSQVKIGVRITNLSENKDATISLGYTDRTLVSKGKKYLQDFTLAAGETADFSCGYSCVDGVADCRNLLKVQGNVLVRRFSMEMTPLPALTYIEGTVLERSELPDLEKADYPDCRFTLRFEGNAILGGKLCNRDLVLTIDGFRESKLLKASQIKPGTRLCCSIVPYEDLPKKSRETQVSDTLNLFQLDNYYVYSARAVEEFSSVSTPFADGMKTYQSIFERHLNPTLPDDVIHAQQEQIQLDKAKMDALLKDYPAKLEQWNAAFRNALAKEIASDLPGRNRVLCSWEECIWREVDGSFWCFPLQQDFMRNYSPLEREKINVLVALKKCLEANGIQLIVSIVPNFYDMAARVILKEFRDIPDVRTALMVKQLSEAGIESVYGADEILANFNRYPFAYTFPHDGHPDDTVQDIMSELVAKRLARFHFPKTLDSDKFSLESGTHDYSNIVTCRFPEKCDIGENLPGTVRDCQCVYYDGKELSADAHSEILVIGNSYIRTPRGNPESFPAHLARHLLTNTDSIMAKGDGGPMVSLMELFFKQPEKYLKGKKVVILHVGVRHFETSLLWRNIETMDLCYLAMNGRKAVREIIPAGGASSLSDKILLPEKHEYACAANTPIVVAKIPCTDLDSSKPVVCMVSAASEPGAPITLDCNGKTHLIPQYLSILSSWNNLIFELPAGTKEITLTISGPAGTVAAFRQFSILQ